MGWFNDALAGSNREPRDEDGQPVVSQYRNQAVQGRQIDELIGLVKGVLADGTICQQEVEFLLRWLESNRSVIDVWPANVLYRRIDSALADGHMDADEEAEIMALLLDAVGGKQSASSHKETANRSTSLPLCKPAPAVSLVGSTFCFTGKFVSGTRAWCEGQIQARGGLILPNITKKLNFLVIGNLGSRDWLHSTHGLKIKKAVEYRDNGLPLHIISEQYWHESLGL